MFRSASALALIVVAAPLAWGAAEPVSGQDAPHLVATGATVPVHLSFELGGTAVSTNNVLPIPGLGVGILFERGMFGISAAMQVDFITICDHGTASDSECGVLWIWDVAPRFTLLPAEHWSPYLAGRIQLARDELHGLVPAAGPRIGFRYRGNKIGLFAEGGPSFIRAQDSEFTGFGRRWFPQVSTGVTLPWL
jgi:hypothetical protein